MIQIIAILKSMTKWGVTSLGKGFYAFSFSSQDVQNVVYIGSLNISFGFLKLFAWSCDLTLACNNINPPPLKIGLESIDYYKSIGEQRYFSLLMGVLVPQYALMLLQISQDLIELLVILFGFRWIWSSKLNQNIKSLWRE